MPAFNKVRVRVANAEYTVMSADSPEYINGLASRLNSQINTMMGEDGRISTVTALVLCALNALDEGTAARNSADSLRLQNQEYAQQAGALRTALDQSSQERAELEEQLQQRKEQEKQLSSALEQLRQQLEQERQEALGRLTEEESSRQLAEVREAAAHQVQAAEAACQQQLSAQRNALEQKIRTLENVLEEQRASGQAAKERGDAELAASRAELADTWERLSQAQQRPAARKRPSVRSWRGKTFC